MDPTPETPPARDSLRHRALAMVREAREAQTRREAMKAAAEQQARAEALRSFLDGISDYLSEAFAGEFAEEMPGFYNGAPMLQLVYVDGAHRATWRVEWSRWDETSQMDLYDVCCNGVVSTAAGDELEALITWQLGMWLEKLLAGPAPLGGAAAARVSA